MEVDLKSPWATMVKTASVFQAPLYLRT